MAKPVIASSNYIGGAFNLERQVMYYTINENKNQIADLSIFEGLEVPEIEKVRQVFMRADHVQIDVWGKKGLCGHVVFQIIGSELHFRLINVKGLREVTKKFHDEFLIPYCVKNGLGEVFATVERKAMEIKLKALGFEKFGQKVWKKAVM